MIIELLAITELNKPPEPPPQPKPQATVQVEPQKKPKPKKIYYKVVKGDTLISIAKKHKTSWQRLFYKNKSIKNPDQLDIGQRIVIPSKTEKLKKRDYMLVESKNGLETVKNSSNSAFQVAPAGYYPAGQCTHLVWTKRPVGMWGDASQWLYNAQKDGLATGSTPKAGAIGWRSGHVIYVESVHGNMVTITEANYDYNGSIRTVTVPASTYYYIY